MPKRKPTLEDALKKELTPTTHTPVVQYRSEIKWVNGEPHLVSAPAQISQDPDNSLRSLMKKCLDLPYDGKDPALQGLSQGEAMVVGLTRDAANGLPAARTELMDRLMGKAQQNVKSVNLTGDINEFLDKVAEQTRPVTIIETVATVRDEIEDL